MDLAAMKELYIGGTQVMQLEIGGVIAWQGKPPPVNHVRTSIDADGSVYNGGLGYRDGFRVRSGGAEGEQAGAACTGFIAVQPGDVIRLSGWAFGEASTANAVNVADAGMANIGQFTMQPAGYGIFAADGGAYTDYGAASVEQERDGVWRWTVPPEGAGVAYIRVTGYAYGSSGVGAQMVVTINEEIA